MSASTLLNLILWQGIGPVFVRSANPTLYPFILAALALALLIFIREIVGDVYRYTRNSYRSLATLSHEMLFDVGSLLSSWALTYVIWLCFTLPYNAFPFLSAPAPGITLGPVSLDALYAFVAIVLHMAASLLALQALGGIWFAYFMPSGVDSRHTTDLAGIVSSSAAMFGWEAQRWPSAFTIPVEMVLIFSFALLLIRLFSPTYSASQVAFRLRHIVVALLALAGLAGVWALHGIGIPSDFAHLIVRSANSTLYPVALVAIVISMVAALVNGALAPIPPVKRQRALQSAAGGIPIVWAFQVGLIWLAWWAITTPYTQLPFVQGSVSWSIGSLPLAPTIAAVATLLHAVILALAISNLLTSWANGLLRIPVGRARTGVLATLLYALDAYVLYRFGWPGWIVTLMELVALSVIMTNLDDWVNALLKWRSADSSVGFRQLQRFKDSLSSVIYFLVVSFIVLSNGSSMYLVEFFGLFYMLSLLDRVVAELSSVWNPQKTSGPVGLLSPRRWYVTMLLAAAIGLVGAAGLFRVITPQDVPSAALWLEAGAAVAAYMVFKPLVEYANYGAADRSRQEDGTLSSGEMIERAMERVALAFAQPAHIATDAQPRLGRIGMPGATTEPARSSTADKHTQGEERAQGIQKGLRLPIGVLFFALALIYHFLTTYLHLTTLLSTSLVPLVFGLIALAASLLQVINVPAMDPPRYVSLLLVFIIIVISGATVLFTLTPLPPPLSAAQLVSLGFLAVIGDESFLAHSVYTLLRELLFLLTLGQLIYLFRLIETALFKFERQSQQTSGERVDGAQDTVELGEWLAERGEREKAIAQFRAAIKDAHDDPRVIRRAGLGLQRAREYVQALAAYERAIELDPTYTIYWNDKGVALEALGRPQEAIVAYDRAIRLEPNYALAWDNKGDALMSLGAWAQALVAYQKAAEMASDNQDVYWNDVCTALTNLRRYEESLAAVDRALKIDNKWAYTWRNRADVLLNLPDRAREALAAAERAVGRDKNSVRGWALYGMTLEASGQSDEARSAWEYALTLDPEPSWTSRGDALAGLGRYEEALTAFDRALKVAPYDPDTWRSKARALRALGRESEALEAERRERELSSGTQPPAP